MKYTIIKRIGLNSLVGLILIFTCGYTYSQENASNPLAAVSNTDLRVQYMDLGDAYLNDFWIDGSYMATKKLKLKYELHYWNSDLVGVNQSGFESFHFKPIYFPLAGEWGQWKYKLAVGLEWILEFGNPQSGQGCLENPILCAPPGTGSDQIAPFVGLSIVAPKGTVLIPLIQQFISYNGYNISITAMRMIIIQALPKGYWGKLDFIAPIDWENDIVPGTGEIQFGKMFSSSFGVYLDGMLGIGEYKPYQWGIGFGIRFNY
jgi:hypothetical protein